MDTQFENKSQLRETGGRVLIFTKAGVNFKYWEVFSFLSLGAFSLFILLTIHTFSINGEAEAIIASFSLIVGAGSWYMLILVLKFLLSPSWD